MTSIWSKMLRLIGQRSATETRRSHSHVSDITVALLRHEHEFDGRASKHHQITVSKVQRGTSSSLMSTNSNSSDKEATSESTKSSHGLPPSQCRAWCQCVRDFEPSPIFDIPARKKGRRLYPSLSTLSHRRNVCSCVQTRRPGTATVSPDLDTPPSVPTELPSRPTTE